MGVSGEARRYLLGLKHFLRVPDYDPDDPEEEYPGGMQPGDYSRNETVELLRKHAENPEAIRFIADMLEE